MRGGDEAQGWIVKPRWGKKIVLIAVLMLVGLLSFIYIDRFFTIRHLHAEIARVTQEERGALAVQKDLRDRLAHADDPATIEYLARKELGLVKPGEEKVIFLKGD
jgi:cell division protein FtsB